MPSCVVRKIADFRRWTLILYHDCHCDELTKSSYVIWRNMLRNNTIAVYELMVFKICYYTIKSKFRNTTFGDISEARVTK